MSQGGIEFGESLAAVVVAMQVGKGIAEANYRVIQIMH